MRFLICVTGLMSVVGAAWAGDPGFGPDGSDAAAGQIVYEARFGGAGLAPSAASFNLRLGSERQLLAHQPVPFRAEYRPATGRFLVNGLDLGPMLVNRQFEEPGVGSTIAGWIPLLIVLSAASFIIIDGNDLFEADFSGTGGSSP